MKKNGFTLAEVLITLGIVGVVSALTIPTLMSNTTKEQIGPKLAKAVSAFEQANQALLNAYSVDSLTDARLVDYTAAVGSAQASSSITDYPPALQKYMKLTTKTENSVNYYISKDGVSYEFKQDTTAIGGIDTSEPAYMQRIGDVVIDIDGPGHGKDLAATDKFYFSWWNDGSLRPKGAINWNGTAIAGGADHWNNDDTCPEGSEPSTTTPAGGVAPAEYCAGHIFENNLKVLYE